MTNPKQERGEKSHWEILYGEAPRTLTVYKNGQFFAAIESTTASCDLVQGLIADYQQAIERIAELETNLAEACDARDQWRKTEVEKNQWRKMCEDLSVELDKMIDCYDYQHSKDCKCKIHILYNKMYAMLGDKPEGEL